MPQPISLLLKFIGKELINPITYLVAFLIGAAINTFQGNSIFFSIVPYIVPLLVQCFAKASIRFNTRNTDILCQLPAERQDPAFVMDNQGLIIAAEGITKQFFNKYKVQRIHQLFSDQEAKAIL